MFEDIRDSITRKFLELKIWVANIPSGMGDGSFAIISRGLFFVYVYGLYEEIVRQIIFTVISQLNAIGTPIDHCIYELYSLALSPEYDAIYGVGNDHKWEKRWAISDKLKENSRISIVEDLPTDGKNIRYRQLDSIARSFGMKDDILPRAELGGYINEMVDNRNAIAHGNKLPKEIGGRYTNQDLLDRCEFISEICTHICSTYEKYITEGKYLRASPQQSPDSSTPIAN